MSVLKYKDPITGEWLTSGTVHVINEGGTSIALEEQLRASGYDDYIKRKDAEAADRYKQIEENQNIESEGE